MPEAEADTTIWFRGLPEISMDAPTVDPLRAAMYDAEKMRHAEPAFVAWLEHYARRVRQYGLDPQDRRARMCQVNPRFVLRN